jgi:hypothetical protein
MCKTLINTLLCLIALCTIIQAQNLNFTVSLNSDLEFEPEIILENLELRDTKIDLRLAYQHGLEFGLAMRQTTSFGPVGTVALAGFADVSSAGHYQLSLNADGVIGPVAARLGGQLFKALPGDFDIAEAFETTRPRYMKGSSIDMGLSYRLSRTQVLSAYPSLYFFDEGFAAKLEVDYKLYKFFDPNDASFLLQAYVSPDHKAFGAIGFQFDLNEKNLPSIAASAWLSLGHQGLLPGAKASLTQSFKTIDSRLNLSLGLEPYRSDFIPYYLRATYTHSVGVGVLEANVYTALGARGMAPLTVNIGYTYKF